MRIPEELPNVIIPPHSEVKALWIDSFWDGNVDGYIRLIIHWEFQPGDIRTQAFRIHRDHAAVFAIVLQNNILGTVIG